MALALMSFSLYRAYQMVRPFFFDPKKANSPQIILEAESLRQDEWGLTSYTFSTW